LKFKSGTCNIVRREKNDPVIENKFTLWYPE